MPSASQMMRTVLGPTPGMRSRSTSVDGISARSLFVIRHPAGRRELGDLVGDRGADAGDGPALAGRVGRPDVERRACDRVRRPVVGDGLEHELALDLEDVPDLVEDPREVAIGDGAGGLRLVAVLVVERRGVLERVHSRRVARRPPYDRPMEEHLATPTATRLAADLVAGTDAHALEPELGAWMSASPRFRAFASDHAAKLRKKLRGASDPDALRDVRLELLVARSLLAERRLELAWEPFGARQGGPDFTVTLAGARVTTLEVTRLHRPAASVEPGVPWLAKLRQLPPGVPNVLVVGDRRAERVRARRRDVRSAGSCACRRPRRGVPGAPRVRRRPGVLRALPATRGGDRVRRGGGRRGAGRGVAQRLCADRRARGRPADLPRGPSIRLTHHGAPRSCAIGRRAVRSALPVPRTSAEVRLACSSCASRWPNERGFIGRRTWVACGGCADSAHRADGRSLTDHEGAKTHRRGQRPRDATQEIHGAARLAAAR